jgi:hypothetical protein
MIREDGVRGLDIVARIEIAKFWAIAAAIGFFSSYLGSPVKELGFALGIIILIGSTIFVYGLYLEVTARAGDKFYNIFTRKTLSREYREEDR